ncbi:MAG: hypothetical protein MJ213_03795 [Bacilli bacterium]|nr:hypothetical protein [Bacilli bacterium]
MKQYTFKNFNYEVANSARKGVKEVRVTFTADGQSVRHYLFIKEIKGKGNAFYVKKAKGIVASRIKSGELAKTANRQIKGFKLSSGALKPVLITLAAVVGVGAVGTGGYFLSQYLGHNPTPTPVETGYTVVLSGGDEGYFGTSEQVTYVVIEDVKEGTKLSEITGYVEPTSKLYKDFTSWIVTGSDNVKFGKNEAIADSAY